MKSQENKNTYSVEQLIEYLEKSKDSRDVSGLFKYATLLIEKSNQTKNHLDKAIGDYYLSLYNYYSGEYDNALLLSKEGLALCENDRASKYYILLCNMVGVTYGTKGDMTNSLAHFLKAYYCSVEFDGSENLFMVLSNIGTIFHNMGFYDKAIEYSLLSFKEREITVENMHASDGIRIVNIFGAYVKLKDYVNAKLWKELLEIYLSKFENETVLEDYYMYEIFMAYDEANYDKVEQLVYKVIATSKKNSDALHTFKDFIGILEVCIEIKNKKLCKMLLESLCLIQEKYKDIKNEIKLNDLIVKMCITFDEEKEHLTKALMNYYESKKNEEKHAEEDNKKNIIMNIELEKVLYEQNIILKKNKELLKNNELDEFTMVYNKKTFTKYVEHDLKTMQEEQNHALILMDIDNFKLINDTYGHSIGDEVLVQAANILKSSVRRNEYVGRIGGDEFCLFMKDIYSEKYLEEKLERILKKLHNIEIDKMNHTITASLGACMVVAKDSYKHVFEKVDEAMYHAKKNGRNQFSLKFNK